MIEILDFINSYTNIILALITGIYAYLTWKMVAEMRTAREDENDASITAFLVPFGNLLVKLRIQNMGRGPAFNVRAKFTFEPASKEPIGEWRQAILLPGSFEEFHFPGHIIELEKLVESYEMLTVNIEWDNLFKKHKQASCIINFKTQKEGWSGVGMLLHEEGVPAQLNGIKKEIASINNYYKKLESERISSEMLAQLRAEQKKKARRPKGKGTIKKTAYENPGSEEIV